MSGGRGGCRLVLGAALVLAAACTRTHAVVTPPGDGGAPVAAAFDSWGELTATLAGCPGFGAPRVTVTTLDDVVDGDPAPADPGAAGPTLSLREALAIGAQWSPLTVTFADSLFPADRPATIRIAGDAPLTVAEGTCVDGRGRGVALAWADGAPAPLAVHGALLGITVLGPPTPVTAAGAEAVVAGCRFGYDGAAILGVGGGDWIVTIEAPVTFGPANLVAGGGVRVIAGSTALSGSLPGVIVDSWFGYDPLTGRDLGLSNALALETDASVLLGVRRNILLAHDRVVQAAGATLGWHENLVGIDRAGRRPGTGLAGLDLAGVAAAYLSENVITGVDVALTLDPASEVALDHNVITGNGAGIVFRGAAPLLPPQITGYAAGTVSGTCAASATRVEVFSDPGDQGALPVGDLDCVAGAFAGPLFPRPTAGRNLTAIQNDPQHASAFSVPFPVPAGG